MGAGCIRMDDVIVHAVCKRSDFGSNAESVLEYCWERKGSFNVINWGMQWVQCDLCWYGKLIGVLNWDMV